ncbi:MAG: CBS domain-containing protein [bacterium]
MKTVKDILRVKGSEVWSIPPDATMLEALQLMAEKNVGALLVVSGKDLKGVLSERDYARKIILHGKASKDTRVREVMTEEPIWVDPDLDVDSCMALMTEKRVRHLPVFRNDTLVGVISIGDLVKAILSDKDSVIDQLEKYIKGHER